MVADTQDSYAVSVADGVATLTLTQGARGNPFDLAACAELGRVAAQLDEDPTVRCVLITAEGRFFSVGGDLRSLASGDGSTSRFIKEATIGFHAGISRLARMRAPVVCAVHALAAGGGVSLAAACDVVLAGRSASFYAAYAGIGLTVDGGGSYFLPRRVGSRRATSFYLRNQTWTAAQAADYGLASEVVEDDALTEAAAALAAELAAGPTAAFGELKALLHSSCEQPLEAQLELEARAMARAGATEDAQAAIAAVAAKQRPTFTGR